jgi:hypothetical protein
MKQWLPEASTSLPRTGHANSHPFFLSWTIRCASYENSIESMCLSFEMILTGVSQGVAKQLVR